MHWRVCEDMHFHVKISVLLQHLHCCLYQYQYIMYLSLLQSAFFFSKRLAVHKVNCILSKWSMNYQRRKCTFKRVFRLWDLYLLQSTPSTSCTHLMNLRCNDFVKRNSLFFIILFWRHGWLLHRILFIGVSSDGSGLVKNLVHTHYSKDNDSKLLNPQDLYLRFAKVTSHPSIGLLQTVGMQSRFGTEYLSQFFSLNFSRFVREELWWRPVFFSGFSAAFSPLNLILTWICMKKEW